VKEPTVFIVDYNDGLKGAAFLMTGLVEDFTVAIEVEGRPEPVALLMNLQPGRPYHHFGCLVRNIETMFETGKPPYPVERTLLTSGILDFSLESRIQGPPEAPKRRNSRNYIIEPPEPPTFVQRGGDLTESGWRYEVTTHAVPFRRSLSSSCNDILDCCATPAIRCGDREHNA
jgi:hypothetical protein